MSKQKTVKKKKRLKEKKPDDRVFVFSKGELKAKLYAYMRKHIGRHRAVSQKQLFTVLFGNPDNYNNLELFYLWQLAKRMMNYMRKSTQMFIVSRKTDKGWRYYVVRDGKDAKPYINLLRDLKLKQDYMMDRCQKAVDEQWWKRL